VLAEADVKIKNGFKVTGIAPPDLASYDQTTRKLYWSWVLKLALARKDKELAQGLDKDGKPLRAISPATRKHRRSAMTPSGKGDPAAPPLMPGYQKSRTRSLLAGRALSTHVDLFWKFDAWTGESWSVVLSYQAARGRDVFGISKEGLAAIKVKSWAMWADWKAGTLRQTAEKPAKRLGVPKIGRYKADHVDYGVSTSGNTGAPANFKPGTWTGFSTPSERAAYFRQTAAASLPGRAANPGSKSPIVGPKYNRLLTHVWGRAGGAAPGGSGPRGPRITPPKTPKTPKPVVPINRLPKVAAPKPAPPPPALKPSPPPWKPTMSAIEADAWGRDSVIRDVLTHVTTQPAAAGIEKEGFRLDLKEKMGRIWGEGTYLGMGPESAEYYKEWTKDPRTLKVRVNVKKVLDFDATGHSPTATQALDVLVEQLGKRERFEQLSKEAEAKNDAILREFQAARRKDPKAYRGEAGDKWLEDHGYVVDKLDRERRIFLNMLKSEGFDAIRVTAKTFTANVGGDQLIVLDPKRIVVIRE
jgi:hypothetical protein